MNTGTPIHVSKEAKAYIVSIRKRLREKHGVWISQKDILDEILRISKARNHLIFDDMPIQKVFKQETRTYGGPMPKNFLELLVKHGFREHGDVAYKRLSEDDVIMVAKRGRASFVITRSPDQLIYKGPLNLATLKEKVKNL